MSAVSAFDQVNSTHRWFVDGGADAWTDAETLLLLEGVEMFDDDWSKGTLLLRRTISLVIADIISVAEHVGTRTAQQCIRHFVQLPIEDSFVGREAAGAGGVRS